jgi:O-acetyl-ADP-ribose deacetylase
MKNRLQVIQGDITKLQVDAIVNAANKSLLGGGGVDGAIHKAAGPELLVECRSLNGCETGEAKITKAYRLPARFVIHTVGPIWNRNKNNNEELLRNCYLNSLQVAKENLCKSIAFPNISTGVYGFPKDLAAKVASQAVKDFLKENDFFEEVYFVCFDEENLNLYKELI